MGAILLGYLAAAVIVLGGICAIGKRNILCLICGITDMVCVVLSCRGFREMLIQSGKVLTAEWFGFGYHKSVLAVYAVMFAIGLVYMLLGVCRLIRSRSIKAM